MRWVTNACPGLAGGEGKRPCVVEKNAVYYDERIQNLVNISNTKSAADCCSRCNAYYTASLPGDDALPVHCNLWTW